MNLPIKYAIPPDIPLPLPSSAGRISYDYVRASLPQEWKPDIVLSVDAGINWTSKPHEGLVATIATDPHVLDYAHQRKISDKFFNMQLCYSEQEDIYLPYAYSLYDHYRTSVDLPVGVKPTHRNTDAILIGMPYAHREEWVSQLRDTGVSVIFENSPVFDEYRELANSALIGLNWSSLNDLNARFFETPAFGLAPVMNIVPDAHRFLTEGEDYLGFTSMGEAVEKVLYLKNNPAEIGRIRENGWKKIRPHTYDARINQVLRDCGYA